MEDRNLKQNKWKLAVLQVVPGFKNNFASDRFCREADLARLVWPEVSTRCEC